MPKAIDVIIYFEHVVRELDACLKLRNELEKKGLSVKVASIHFDRYLNILKYKPRMVVLPFFYGTKDITYFQFKEAYQDVLVLNLHQEQLYNSSTRDFFIPQTETTRNVYHIAWSDQFYTDLKEAGISEHLLKLTGNPRTDNYYLRLPERMRKYQDQEIVFIPTSFSWYFVDSNYFLSNPAIKAQEFYMQRELTERTVYSFFRSLRNLAAKFPGKLFVLRPHPFDPIGRYREVLVSVHERPLEPNIVISREGNVYEWLNVAELVISWLSTVALEATVFGKKNIVWQPIALPDKMQMAFIPLYDRIYQREDEVEAILRGTHQVEKNHKVRDFALKSFGKVDGTVNASIAAWISEILTANPVRQIPQKGVFWKNLFKTCSIDLPKRLLRSLHLITRVSFYKAIAEDLWTVGELDSKYEKFKAESL